MKLSYDAVDEQAVDLRSMIQLWHGRPKIGKTVTATTIPGGCFFLKFEPGHKHVRHHGATVNAWREMLDACATIAADVKTGRFPFGTVAIDTVGMAFVRCQEHVLGAERVQHEADSKNKRAYALIEREFRRVMTKLSNLGLGVVFIAHTTEEHRKKGQREWIELKMDLPKAGRRVIPPLVDLLLFFDLDEDSETGAIRRVIRTRGTNDYEAGVRYPPGWTCAIPETIPMDYTELLAAWSRGAPSSNGAPPSSSPTLASMDARVPPSKSPAPAEDVTRSSTPDEVTSPPEARVDEPNAELRANLDELGQIYEDIRETCGNDDMAARAWSAQLPAIAKISARQAGGCLSKARTLRKKLALGREIFEAAPSRAPEFPERESIEALESLLAETRVVAAEDPR